MIPSALRSRIYLDFWNFQLNWNDQVPDGKGANRIDWAKLGKQINQRAEWLYQRETRKRDYLNLVGRNLFVGLTTDDESQPDELERWLMDIVGTRFNWSIHLRHNHRRPKPAYCQKCRKKHTHCPSCNERFVVNEEKGVDTALATRLLVDGWEDDVDVAIIVSSDADFIPAVEHVRTKGVQVINLGWQDKGFHLRQASTAAVTLDSCWKDFALKNHGRR